MILPPQRTVDEETARSHYRGYPDLEPSDFAQDIQKYIDETTRIAGWVESVSHHPLTNPFEPLPLSRDKPSHPADIVIKRPKQQRSRYVPESTRVHKEYEGYPSPPTSVRSSSSTYIPMTLPPPDGGPSSSSPFYPKASASPRAETSMASRRRGIPRQAPSWSSPTNLMLQAQRHLVVDPGPSRVHEHEPASKRDHRRKPRLPPRTEHPQTVLQVPPGTLILPYPSSHKSLSRQSSKETLIIAPTPNAQGQEHASSWFGRFFKGLSKH